MVCRILFTAFCKSIHWIIENAHKTVRLVLGALLY